MYDRKTRKSTKEFYRDLGLLMEIRVPQKEIAKVSINITFPDRQFVCAPDDLTRFQDGVNKFASMIPYNGNVVDFMDDFFWKYYMELVSFGLNADKWTWQAIKTWQSTYDLIDFHYAIHHVIFQLHYATQIGAIKPNQYRAETYASVTEDCSYEDKVRKSA